MRTVLAILMIASWILPLAAQDVSKSVRPDPMTPQGENLQVPLGWNAYLDRDRGAAVLTSESERGHDEIFFVNMTPGWHLTTGPAGVFYHPASTAEGEYRAETKIHLFPPGNRNEAFGIFIGGAELGTEAETYLYFLIRRSGEFLVKRRDGDETSVLQNWTAHPAIVAYADGTEGSIANTLAVEARADELDFFVNGEKVTSLSRAGLPVDGIVGLRVNHHLNLHVEDLRVE